TRTSLSSLDPEVDRHRLSAPVDLHGEIGSGSEPRISFERLLRARHVETVDGLEAIAVLEAERAEQRVRPDAEHADADHLAVLLLRHDARGAHQLGLVFQDLVDHGAIDVELGLADLLDLGSDLGRYLAG